MKKETYVFIRKSATQGQLVSASNFLGVDADGSNAIQVSFKNDGGDADAQIFKLNYSSGKIKEACEALANVLAGQNRGFLTIGDNITGEYLQPFTNVIS
jgi:hypothetical protein